MPKVTLNPVKNKKIEAKRLIVGQMRSQGLRQSDLCREIGITQQCFSHHLEEMTFSYSQMLSIIYALGFTEEERKQFI